MWVGCNPVALEIDNIDAPEPQIVVSSLILQDSSVCVLLTRSISALEANHESEPADLIRRVAINDAEVTIASAGKIYPLTLLQDGTYQAKDIPLEVGQSYDLKAVSRSMGEVTATAVMQPPAFFGKVAAKAVIYPVENHWLNAVYGLKDGEPENYYIISIQKAKRKSLMERVINPRAYTRVLDDTRFSGETFEEAVVITDAWFAKGDSIAFTLSNVSRAYYEYVKLRVENELELVQYFAEPITYPTNIHGGRGFFNMYYSDLRIVLAQ